MLSVYTRHYPPCLHKDIHCRRCRCPKWIQGILENKGPVRLSSKTRSWTKAEIKLREMERAADPTAVRASSVTVEAAIEAFLADQGARRLAISSIKKSESLLKGQFLLWCQGRQVKNLEEVGPVEMREFRYTWDTSPVTARRKHERMCSFFAFCISSDWTGRNPMNGLKKPKAPDMAPTNYFTRTDFKCIVNATYRYEYGGQRLSLSR